MNVLNSLVGQRYGNLTVLEKADDYVSPRGDHLRKWLCQCVCGNKSIVMEQSLKRGATKSCGCYRYSQVHNSKNFVDLSGERFGKLLVIKRANESHDYVSKKGQHQLRWVCQCDCGKTKITTTQGLNSGRCSSCGCHSKKLTHERFFQDWTGKKIGELTIISRADDYISPQGNRIVQYNCRCSCGNSIVVLSNNLKRGHTMSCGCKRIRFGTKKRLDTGQASFNGLYRRYQKLNGKKRELDFNITKDQFRCLTSRDCYYCGAKPSNIFGKKYANGAYIYNGLDRIDSSKGYTLDNVVPCCKKCNYAKNNMTFLEFKEWVNQVHLNFLHQTT